jgi:predicted helicase
VARSIAFVPTDQGERTIVTADLASKDQDGVLVDTGQAFDLLLDALRGDSFDERDKGDRFERLVVEAMRVSPMLAPMFDQVWMWSDWPDKPASGRDLGIDIVAVDAETGGLVAIQCKFYRSSHRLQKAELDSFFAESGKAGFVKRIIATTADDLSANLADTLSGQQIPVSLWDRQVLADCGVDWSTFRPEQPEARAVPLPLKQLRDHQRAAIDAVRARIGGAGRGKLIMACGTGKTFTSLKLVEEHVGAGGRVLFLVPSLALLSQTLTEWTQESALPLRCFAVCSDSDVGKKRAADDDAVQTLVHELEYPATTAADRLAAAAAKVHAADHLTVIFATYHSLAVVHEAQHLHGLPAFDLIVCDEAHRTTGDRLVDEDESAFLRVHDAAYVRGGQRLYMTATPRVYGDAAKATAEQGGLTLCSMDDEALFGPTLHTLSFSSAVKLGLLVDYKVLVLAVEEAHVSRRLQELLKDSDNDLRVDDAARIVGCWKALAKLGLSGALQTDPEPMRRAVAFCQVIEAKPKAKVHKVASKSIAGMFQAVVEAYQAGEAEAAHAAARLRCEAAHVDGSMNATEKQRHIDWLKAEAPPDTCRILSNVRCLSEGVDVPALDAVLFLTPRNSQVDVVQSVGRVMRRAPGKLRGYVVLPVVIPAGVEPHEALNDNQTYKVVWQVLQALRSHDDRFDADINHIELNRRDPERIGTGNVPGGDDPYALDGGRRDLQLSLHFAEYRDAVLARIVKKVGQRTYWAQWADDVRLIAETHIVRINEAIRQPAKAEAFERFLVDLQQQLNPGITADDAIHMLAQHIITRPVFDAIFGGYEFSAHNPVSVTMQAMVDVLEDQSLHKDAGALEQFYESVRVRAAGIDNHEGRQAVITELYEQFFKKALPKTADAFGIVYTPLPVVDWMIDAVNTLLQRHFDTDLSSEGVQVLDPFTGTGTFIVRMLQSGLIRPEDLARKYASELHANEILLLAYYIAAVNIEATYHQLVDADGTEDYVPFDGIVLTDTFQLAEDRGSMDAAYFPDNRERVVRQQAQDITVIIGNPPYSAGQTSNNDANQNQAYPALDKQIAGTYALGTGATSARTLYDSYFRAFRWASDRIGDAGIVCFVSNGGWIDSNSADGFRKCLADEFDQIYVYNLRGNARTAGAQRQKESGNVFGSGSRATVAISILIRTRAGSATIRYSDVGDYLTREQKLAVLGTKLDAMEWQTITPNVAGDWVNQRRDDFDTFAPLGDKSGAFTAVLDLFSLGVATGKDAWCWNYSRWSVEANVDRMIAVYNEHADRAHSKTGRPDSWIDLDPTRISWTRALKASVAKGRKIDFDPTRVVRGAYRPFSKQYLYFDRQLNEMVYRQPAIYPHDGEGNWGISLTGAASHYEFTPLATSGVPDLHVLDSGQFFPRYRYEVPPPTDADSLFAHESTKPRKIDNVNAETLDNYRRRYGDDVDGDMIFHYIYGLLHSPEYRTTYAADLRRQLPRIPMLDAFREFAAAGRKLTDLHLGYETVAPYPLEDPSLDWDDPEKSDWLRVQKMKFRSKADKSAIVYNHRLALAGIPDEAHEYMVGPRSALEWIIDRYQVRTHKDSGIVNDPNDWCTEVANPRYIVDLIKRITTVSVETVAIVQSLPPLNLD